MSKRNPEVRENTTFKNPIYFQRMKRCTCATTWWRLRRAAERKANDGNFASVNFRFLHFSLLAVSSSPATAEPHGSLHKTQSSFFLTLTYLSKAFLLKVSPSKNKPWVHFVENIVVCPCVMSLTWLCPTQLYANTRGSFFGEKNPQNDYG